MSLKQVYVSDPMYYFPAGEYPHFLPGADNPMYTWRPPVPRNYDETLGSIQAVWSEKSNEVSGRATYGMLAQLATRHFPWKIPAAHYWDWRSGALLEHVGAAAGGVTFGLTFLWYDLTTYIATTPRNEFFRMGLGSGDRTPVDRYSNPIGPAIPATHWEGTYKPGAPFAVSVEHDWLVAPSWEAPKNTGEIYGPWLHVYAWSSGARLRSFACVAEPRDVFPEDGHFVWVLCVGGYLQLVDIRIAETVGVVRVDLQPDQSQVRGLYDRYQRRILLFEHTPDALDGAPTSRFRGYWPNELPKRLLRPIPLQRPRAGQVSPYVTRVVGDLTLPMPGVAVTPGADPPGSLLESALYTDAAGYALGHLQGDTAGSGEVTVEAEV